MCLFLLVSMQWRILTYIPKNFYRTRGSKTYKPKNFYMKTTYMALLSEKFGKSPPPPPPSLYFPLFLWNHSSFLVNFLDPFEHIRNYLNVFFRDPFTNYN
ncbi:hypothetical protein Hanom_Chr09g00822921 [Helianthus anomalus]